jgi:hypothetical protein
LILAFISPGAFASDRAWPWLLGIYGMTITADAHSTALALQHEGVEEVGIPYRWLPEEDVPPARLMLGAVGIYGLHQLHKTRPRLARTITIVAFSVTGAVAYQNYRLHSRLHDLD